MEKITYWHTVMTAPFVALLYPHEMVYRPFSLHGCADQTDRKSRARTAMLQDVTPSSLSTMSKLRSVALSCRSGTVVVNSSVEMAERLEGGTYR